MIEFSSLEAAVSALDSTKEPIYEQFQLSSSETKRYMLSMGKMITMAEKYGINDNQHVLVTGGALIGGFVATFLGIASFNPAILIAGLASCAKGLALSDQSETLHKRFYQNIEQAINADRELCAELQVIVDLREAAERHMSRNKDGSHPYGHLCFFKEPTIRYIRRVSRSAIGGYSAHFLNTTIGYTASFYPEKLQFGFFETCDWVPPNSCN